MPAQVTIFCLLFGGLQGLLFTLFLVRRKLYRSGYIFLLFYFGVLLLQITLKVMSKGWLMYNWPLLYSISYHLPFLYGPFIYLFVRQMTSGQKWRWTHLLHFIPFAAALAILVSRDSYTFLISGEPRLMYQLFSITIYHWLAYRQCERYSATFKKYYADSRRLQLRWLRQFIISSFILCCVIAVTIYAMYVLYPSLDWLRMGFVALTIFIYWVSYAALTQPDIFNGQTNAIREPAIVTDITPRLQVSRAAPKYRNSSLPDAEARRIIKDLEQVMTVAKPQLDPEITIDSLAKMVSSNRHHLSQVLNEKIGLSFYDYINSYRVNEAKSFLSDPERANQKIASIAYDAGFNSLSAFNDVFKKMTGQTPSQYRKQPHAPAKVQRG